MISAINPALAAVSIEQVLERTTNGALCPSTTLDACLDFFGKGPACRDNVENAWALFVAAYNEDPELALRILFYLRDIRGGQGERAIFRALIQGLVLEQPEVVGQMAPLFSEYGRWDDLFCLENTSVAPAAFDVIRKQLNADLTSDTPSLLAKWLPSINASSHETKRLGRVIASALMMTEKAYRQTLSKLRKQIRVVETAMCSGDWSDINYQSVPAQAMRRYRNAFSKRDETRFGKYLEDVKNGTAEIKAGTLFPYELVEQFLAIDLSFDKTEVEGADVLDAQWAALPNYMEEDFNGIVVADVSGSMSGRPMAVAISLAMYIAERNTSETFKDHFITFSSDPQMQKIKGETLAEKVANLSNADWGMSTNVNKVFQLLLDAAVRQSVPASEMPTKLIIVSDMQFDQASTDHMGTQEQTNFQQIRKMYQDAGYEPPHLVFWNCRGDAGQPFTVHESGAHLVGGCSPSILKSILNNKLITAVDVMNDAVSGERYDAVSLAYQTAASFTKKLPKAEYLEVSEDLDILLF